MNLVRTSGSILASAALLACLAGCSGGTPTSAPTASAPTGTITVFAAASLTEVFTELATRFEAEHPGTTVQSTFAGSSDLVTQITNGAPADVFASADEATIARLDDAGLVAGSPVDIATNTLRIVVPPANPAGITSFADLAEQGVKTVVCAPAVPCGAATAAVEEASGVELRPVSEESSVSDVLGKVASGEADAGIVYVTDAEAAGDSVTAIALPEAEGIVNTYPISAVRGSSNPALAAEFLEFVSGDEGLEVLADAGFGAP